MKTFLFIMNDCLGPLNVVGIIKENETQLDELYAHKVDFVKVMRLVAPSTS